MQALPASVHAGTRALRYKTYPLRVILDGVTLYNLGYSLPEAAQKLKSNTVTRSPIHPCELDGRASRIDDLPPLREHS